MTRQQIDHYLSIHRAQRDRAKKMLDERYFELEERNEETQWINVYLKHKTIVEALEMEKPDD